MRPSPLLHAFLHGVLNCLVAVFVLAALQAGRRAVASRRLKEHFLETESGHQRFCPSPEYNNRGPPPSDAPSPAPPSPTSSSSPSPPAVFAVDRTSIEIRASGLLGGAGRGLFATKQIACGRVIADVFVPGRMPSPLSGFLRSVWRLLPSLLTGGTPEPPTLWWVADEIRAPGYFINHATWPLARMVRVDSSAGEGEDSGTADVRHSGANADGNDVHTCTPKKQTNQKMKGGPDCNDDESSSSSHENETIRTAPVRWVAHALRTIDAGEEITLDYWDGPWWTLPPKWWFV